MSLRLWFPLIGNFNNQGLDKLLAFTTTGTISDQPGKIGQSKEFNSSNVICNDYNFTLGTEASFCCWVYYNALPSSSSNDWIFDIASTSGYTNSVLGLATEKNTKLAIMVGGKSDATYIHGFSLNTWYHIAFSWNNNQGKLYINGQLVKTYTNLNNGTLKTSTKFSIASNVANSSTKFKGRLNDLRIYDHCLSQKEVEEIAKGLVLHYKLDNDGFGNENYWGNGKPLREDSSSLVGELRTMFARTDSTYASVPTFIPNEYIEIKFLSTRTPVENGGIQFQKLQRYSGTINSMCPILEHLKTGEQLTISYELYVTSPVIARCHITKVLDGTSTKLHPDIDPIQISTLNTWTKVSQSIEIPSSFDESNITTESRLGIYISIREILGTTSTGEVTIRIRNIKLEKGQVATTWTPARADFGHSSDNIIFDSSGYNNNGSVIGSLETITSDSRYDYATYFDGNTSGILIENLQLSNIINDKITYSFWINPNGENGARSTYFGSYFATSWSIEKTTGNVLRLWWNGSPDESATGASITDGIWQHICVVKNGTNDIKVYINGIQKWVSTTTHSALNFPTTYRIGRDTRTGTTSYHGSMSDFRIYATALTAEQVKELYNTSTTIDNQNNIYARELVEL